MEEVSRAKRRINPGIFLHAQQHGMMPQSGLPPALDWLSPFILNFFVFTASSLIYIAITLTVRAYTTRRRSSAAPPLTFTYHDHFLGKAVCIPVVQQLQIAAPLMGGAACSQVFHLHSYSAAFDSPAAFAICHVPHGGRVPFCFHDSAIDPASCARRIRISSRPFHVALPCREVCDRSLLHFV